MNRSTLKNIGITSARAAMFAALFAIPYPLRAFVLLKVWTWFITPLGVKSITYFGAFCLVLVSSLFLVNVHKNQAEHIKPGQGQTGSSALEDIALVTLETSLRCGVILLFAFIVHLLGPK